MAMQGPVKINKKLQDEVAVFLSNRHGDGMRLKGMLMMQNLAGLQTVSAEVAKECQKYGFNVLADLLIQTVAAAKKGDVAACMALVSEYEVQSANLKVEYD